ncbi:hypothetical protein ACKKBG_A07990 [Auxenochlorella protothecoides x Auxenochlorella symbiontica]
MDVLCFEPDTSRLASLLDTDEDVLDFWSCLGPPEGPKPYRASTPANVPLPLPHTTVSPCTAPRAPSATPPRYRRGSSLPPARQHKPLPALLRTARQRQPVRLACLQPHPLFTPSPFQLRITCPALLHVPYSMAPDPLSIPAAPPPHHGKPCLPPRPRIAEVCPWSGRDPPPWASDPYSPCCTTAPLLWLCAGGQGSAAPSQPPGQLCPAAAIRALLVLEVRGGRPSPRPPSRTCCMASRPGIPSPGVALLAFA